VTSVQNIAAQIQAELHKLDQQRAQLERALAALNTVPRIRSNNGTKPARKMASGEHRDQASIRNAMKVVEEWFLNHDHYKGPSKGLAGLVGLPEWQVRRAVQFLAEDGVLTKTGRRNARVALAEPYRETVVRPGEGVSEGRIAKPGIETPA
jgi:hypothetical protein